MKLLELEPKWLMFDGRRVGFVFRCPTRQDNWQTCFVEKFYLFKSRTGEYLRDAIGEWLGSAPDSQCAIIKDALTADIADSHRWQSCNPDHQWTVEGGIANASFETISVMPSLDGSAGGNWHGFVTNGEIVGGI